MKSSRPVILVWWCLITSILISTASAQERSIRFYGNGYSAPDSDRIKIPLTGSAVNVSEDFTIECWLKCVASENSGSVSAADHGDGWITGNIFLDRDVYGTSDSGDFGLAIGASVGAPEESRFVAFGLNRLDSGITIRGNINIADNNWHHIAVTRNGSTGMISLFIDGVPDVSATGPRGNIAYQSGRTTSYPHSDPYLVIGAEKHDAGAAYPAYSGFMDELRISNSIRYLNSFVPSSEAFIPDRYTAGLYHFNEGMGLLVKDDIPMGYATSHGKLFAGGSPVGPVWITESPFPARNPLKWQTTNIKKDGQRIVIRWSTESNPELSGFEIQRSIDGTRFTTIGHVDSERSCTECNYSFTDTHPSGGRNYYRIKHTASTGKVSYSGNIIMLFTQIINPYKVYLNGTNLIVKNTSVIESLVVWNSEGKRLAERKNLKEGTTQVSINNSKGFAFVHINLEDGSRFTEKIMLR